jgi:hypothetical protein
LQYPLILLPWAAAPLPRPHPTAAPPEEKCPLYLSRIVGQPAATDSNSPIRIGINSLSQTLSLHSIYHQYCKSCMLCTPNVTPSLFSPFSLLRSSMLQGLTATPHHTSKPLSLLISAIQVRSARRELCLVFGISSKDSIEAASQVCITYYTRKKKTNKTP